MSPGILVGYLVVLFPTEFAPLSELHAHTADELRPIALSIGTLNKHLLRVHLESQARQRDSGSGVILFTQGDAIPACKGVTFTSLRVRILIVVWW